MLKIFKWAAFTVMALFMLAQLVRPAKVNPQVNEAVALEAHSEMDPEVAALLKRACADCHSNRTEWPWYSNVAPVSWFVIDHVNHGRSHLNFSTWAEYRPAERVELLENICEWVRLGWMPMESYTLMHSEARLSEQDKATICEWASRERERLLADNGRKREGRPSNN
ncbi:MAG TPA: heme-binding domain-containing protein [Blastocatellia bacterium]|nr:heme-binding domain-containing protein [Blastocatellia bacterium]